MDNFPYKKLKEIRGHAEETQESLASKTGLKRTHISALESREKINPTIDTLIAYLEGCGSNLQDLFNSSIPKDFSSPERRDFHEKIEFLLDFHGKIEENLTYIINLFYSQAISKNIRNISKYLSLDVEIMVQEPILNTSEEDLMLEQYKASIRILDQLVSLGDQGILDEVKRHLEFIRDISFKKSIEIAKLKPLEVKNKQRKEGNQ